MTQWTPHSSRTTVEWLSDLPRSDRAEALENIVETEFKESLLMADEDVLPHDQSFFDLGLTSLSITKLKQRLEDILHVELDANLLFNQPTVQAVLEHIMHDRLPDLFGAPEPVPAQQPASSAAPADPLLQDVLKDLYES
ncbi:MULTISPECIES: acyl carrier protein [Streptomyces]|uniref:Carrier domain-containing protein n=1 Tax=Streptomyces canarius TaxID=285453 RepID=A0ABQ3CUQ4_9ACTN|nr:acyl carrier protein [Streptomyces canarius]GHA33808.1 hypothetical protein GCM10010345_42930 [Streptomyces canarius]